MLYHWFSWRPRVSEREVKKVWSPEILQFHMEKNKSWKSLISLLSLLCLVLSSQTHSPVLLFTFSSLLKAERKIKPHLQVWISEIHQGFALFYQEFRHVLGCANWDPAILLNGTWQWNTRIWYLQFHVSTWERTFHFRKLQCKSQIISRRNLSTKKPVSQENHSYMWLISLWKLVFQFREMYHDLVNCLVPGKTNILSYPKFRRVFNHCSLSVLCITLYNKPA